ncbi:MAG: hypothetical protein JW795_10105 [Chitinivibrionales bacterium]|nr:hypothetical protein [Chitinivibrionales bacterium]
MDAILPALDNNSMRMRNRILHTNSERIILSDDYEAEQKHSSLYTTKGLRVEVAHHHVRDDWMEIKPLVGSIAKGYYILHIRRQIKQITIPYILVQ